jgi:phospholipase A1
MHSAAFPLMAIALIAAAPASAEPLRTIISAATPIEGERAMTVELTFLNEGAELVDAATPDSVAVMLHVGGASHPLTLRRVDPAQALPPGGFVRARYRLELPQSLAAAPATLSLPGDPNAAQIALSLPPDTATAAVAPSWDEPEGNDFLDRVTAYQPVYVVRGAGTDSDGKIQISLKYRLFDLGGGEGRRRHAIHVGYTQRMLWDLGAESIPFRNIDFQPELFYLSRGPDGDGARLDWQLGYQHQSNGKSNAESRSYNILYAQPSLTLPLGR